MATYLHPGVYLEELSSGSNPITAVESSTALFIGITNKGPLETTLITKLEDYQTLYGGIQDTQKESVGDAMGYSVTAFFQNGGSKAYIARLDNGGKIAKSNWKSKGASINGFVFNAANQGAWGNTIRINISLKDGTQDLYVVEVGYGVKSKFDEIVERYTDVSLDPQAPLYLLNQINGYSELITVTEQNIDTKGTADTEGAADTEGKIDTEETTDTEGTTPASNDPVGATYFCLTGGSNGKALVSGSDPSQDEKGYDAVFSEFLNRRDKNIIHLPGQYWNKANGNAIIDKGIAHCEAMKNCMILVDIDPSVKLNSEKSVTDLKLPTKTYSVIYYPWIRVSNIFYNSETNPGVPTTVLVPPGGFVAGIWAKTDSKRGIWKAPAGVETALLGVAGLSAEVSDADQDFLNPLGINAVRSLPGYGCVLWGTRTSATKAAPEWRYIPVRRTAIYIEESLYNGVQWAVFEQNNHVLWSALRANVGAFMDNLFRAGAFQGDIASDAYFVRCGLGDTMTQYDIDAGQVIVQVGFAPLKPAEFVILRIQQKVNQQ